MSTLTPWFRCVDAQPVRVGWYDVRYHGNSWASEVRHWWDGRWWRNKPRGTLSAFGNGGKAWPRDSWRGQVKP